MNSQPKRVVILGAGFGGAYAAKTLETHAGPDLEVILIDRNNYVLFYPLLVEAGVGTIEARHVVVPVRKFVHKVQFLMAEIESVDLSLQEVRVKVKGSDAEQTIRFDHLIMGLGSVTRTPDIPGLEKHGFQIKTLIDAISLRDRAIRLLELANTLPSPEARRELLTCVVVGANFTGVEFAGEYQAFLKEAAEAYPNVDPEEVRMILLEYADKILGGTTRVLADWCKETLEKRGVDIRTGTSLKEVGADYAVTTSGDRIPTHTVLWAAGIAPNPLTKNIAGLPTNKHGYIDCETDLRVKGFETVWCVGDSATVMSPTGAPYVATAQTASRQGPLAARNIVAKLAGQPTKPFHFKPLGSFAAIGRKQASAEVLGLNIKGFLGWVMYRGAYLVKMPSLGMKLRLLADWTTELVFRNEPVQLGVHRQIDADTAELHKAPSKAELL